MSRARIDHHGLSAAEIREACGCSPRCLSCKRAKAREYYRANVHRGWVSNYRARALASGYQPVVERFNRDDVVACWGGACVYCGGPFEELDHFIPVESGGRHTLENVRPSCSKCNGRKMRRDGRFFK